MSLLAVAVSARAQTFTPAGLTANPATPWTLGWKPAGQQASSILNVYNRQGNVSGLTTWDSTNGLSGSANANFNGTANSITLPGVGTWVPGAVGLHAGNGGQSSVLRFTAPTPGLYTIAATFSRIDTSNVRAYEVIDGVQVNTALVNNFNPVLIFPTITRYVGSFVDFALDGQFGDSNTRVAPTITRFTGPGSAQNNPVLPTRAQNGVFVFENAPSGAWFDPPLVDAFEFAMTGGQRFTSILDFPSGIGDSDNLFTVRVGGTTLGQFAPGQSVVFENFGFTGGVSGFTVSGIGPAVDAANPTAFPIQLAFNAPLASFTMQGVSTAAPEPGTLALLGVGALGGAGLFGRQRKLQS